MIEPPWSSTICLTMASPKPVPPWDLDVSRYACSKSLKICASLSSGIPIPVSVRANSIVAFSAYSFNMRTLMVIFPSVVNFIALLKRFKIIWRKRIGSPTKIWGIVWSNSSSNSKFFSLIFVSNNWRIVEMETDKSNGICSKVIFPASTLARSSISLIKTTKASPETLIAFM